MRRTLLIIVFVLSFTSLIPAQTIEQINPRPLIISTSVLEYFPTIQLGTGNINLGAELYLKNKKSIYGNLGFITTFEESKGSWFTIYSEKTLGFKAQIGGKHFLNKH